MTTPKVWFITGASSGFGRAVAETVLKNGDIAVATLRKPSALADLAAAHPASRLLVLPLEVREPETIRAAFARAIAQFGRVDVVFNNAGVAVMGEAEGTDGPAARGLFDVNFWGAASVTLEAVRVLREVNEPRGGLILQNTSQTAFAGVPMMAYYSATKSAVEAFSRSLITELDPAWNIKFTLIEPGSFHTGIKGNMDLIPLHPAYATAPGPTGLRQWLANDTVMSGDPAKAGAAIYKLGSLPEPPLYFPLGKDAVGYARAFLEKMTQDVDQYESWSDDVER